MPRYIITDGHESSAINEETLMHVFNNNEELIKYANDFYHETFKCEESYDETFNVTSIRGAVRLLNGSNYLVHRCYEIIVK